MAGTEQAAGTVMAGTVQAAGDAGPRRTGLVLEPASQGQGSALHKQVVRSLVLSLNLLVRDRAAALHRQVVRSEWQMQKAL